MILVVGATGLVGSEVCRKLVQRGHRVRALVRTSSDPARVGALKANGVDCAVGDLKQPDTLAAACRGAEAVISTATSMAGQNPADSIASVDAQGQLNLVEAAKSAGIQRFVFVSFRHPPGSFMPLADAKSAVEHAIADMNFTVIQASFFMDVWLSPALGFNPAAASARIYGPGTAPTSWVASSDVAEMCVLALEHPSAQRRTLEFGGPEPISPLEIVARFERLGGKPFTVEHVPLEALQAQFAAATDPTQKTYAALMLGYANGDPISMQSLEDEFGLSLRTLDEYARAILPAA